LSWNPDNAYLFDSDGKRQVQVYLFRSRPNASVYKDVVSLNPGENSTNYLLVSRSSNSINFTVEPGWLPENKDSIPVKKYSFRFRVIPSGTEESNEGDIYFFSPSFSVIRK